MQWHNQLMRLEGDYNYHQQLLNLKHEFPIVSAMSNIAGLTSMPSITIWDEPRRLLFNGMTSINKYQIKVGYILLQLSSVKMDKAHRILYQYAGQNITGADRAITFFTFVKKASVTTVGAVSGALTKSQLAGSAIGTSYGSLLEVIGQGMEVHYGTRDRIDWVGISSDAAWDLVFALLSDKVDKQSQKLADKIIKKAFGREVMKEFTNDKIKKAIVEILENKAEDVVKLVVNDTIKWATSSNPPVTWESFWEELKDQFSANELFWDAVEVKLNFKGTKNVHMKW